MVQADHLLNTSNTQSPYTNALDTATLSELVELLSKLLCSQMNQT